MMETSIWSDSFLVDSEWGLDVPFHQENGLFGDLKFGSHVDGTEIPSFQPQEAGESSFSSEIGGDEGSLSLDWMDSSDLNRYLSELDGFDTKVEPLLSSVQEPQQLPASQITVRDHYSLKERSSSNAFEEAILSKEAVFDEIGFDALLSSPQSPEQVIPVIQFEVDFSAAEQSPVLLTSKDIVFDKLEISQVTDFDDTVGLSPGDELISSPLSTDDVETLFTTSEPVSPNSVSSTDESSIFKASPELYKIISTSSLDISNRVSPYPKSKPKKEPRSPNRRSPAQPVPEHVISEQVNKKDRKKLQNKNAAIRYRQKKKDEALGIKSEEQVLEEHNSSLKTKVDDLEREIKYMKGLMQDIYKAKGLLV